MTTTALIRLDAAISGIAGLGLAAAAPVLDDVLGIPIAVLVPLGLLLLLYAGDLVLVARCGAARSSVRTVIAANVAWAALSVVALLANWLTTTTAGTVV